MKTAVVYYTLDGNCALVAQEIKTRMDADLIRLRTEDEKKRSRIGKFFWGGGMVFLNKKPPLKPYSFDASAYDLIIIGAPVWASSPAPPVKTFLSETGIKNKKVAVFVCHAGGKGDSLDKFKALLEGNEIAGAADFKEPYKGGEEVKNQIADWVKSLS
jgi:flavodoxin